MRIPDMTYKEVREYLQGNSILIIPVATQEQHGPHLPTNTDQLQAEYYADELSKRTGCLIAQTICYGVNLPVDSLFTGSAGISEDTLHNTLKELVGWWGNQGFQRFFILNVHGDPFHERALENIADNVHLLKPYDIDYANILENQETMRHSCEAETSVMMYLYPERVRQDCIKDQDIPFCDFRKYLYHAQSNPPAHYNGSLGYPSLATTEKGKQIVERAIQLMMEQYNLVMSNNQSTGI